MQRTYFEELHRSEARQAEDRLLFAALRERCGSARRSLWLTALLRLLSPNRSSKKACVEPC